RPLHLGCVWLPAYSRRIDEQFGPAQSHQPRSLRIPLVPADQYSQPANRCCNGAEPQVTRREIGVFRKMSTFGLDFCPVIGAAYYSPKSEERHPGVVTPRRTSSYPVGVGIADPLLFKRAADPWYPIQPFRGKKPQKPPQGELIADRHSHFSSRRD